MFLIAVAVLVTAALLLRVGVRGVFFAAASPGLLFPSLASFEGPPEGAIWGLGAAVVQPPVKREALRQVHVFF